MFFALFLLGVVVATHGNPDHRGEGCVQRRLISGLDPIAGMEWLG